VLSTDHRENKESDQPVIASGWSRVRTTMLPPFNENGDLPPGVHATSLNEIGQRFGTGRTARVRAWRALRHLHELALRTGSLRNFYVFGSFVSSAPDPRDVDVVLVMDEQFRLENCPRESRTLFSHADAEARYGASVFWLREGAMPEELLRAWQMKRDGTLRGILEVA
jgi:hypothetical protein